MRKILATLSVGTLMVLAAPGIAQASSGSGGGDEVRVNGVCTASSSSKLKIKTDNGQIETEFEVDQNVVGDTWRVRVTDNGTVVARGKKVTVAPSGSFTFRRRIPNLAGTDTVTARAKNLTTGEVCTATASL
jgi:DUF4097 and DUF4098 domain-containing protein YvlB